MKGFTHWRARIGLLAGAALAAVLITGMPIQAQPEALAPGPPAMLLELADPELAQITHDIILLRIINQIGMTPDQIAAVIPALEGLLREERAMRSDVKRLMLEQRRALLKGDVPAAELEASRRKMKERTQAFRTQVRQRIEGLGQHLSQQQVRRLGALVLTGPSLWRHGPVERPTPGPRPMQPRRGPRGMMAPPAGDDMGPSARVLERIIALLKEKLQVMRPAA